MFIQVGIALSLVLDITWLLGFCGYFVLASWFVSLILILVTLIKRLEVVPQFFSVISYFTTYLQALIFLFWFNINDVLQRYFVGFYAIAILAILPLAYSDSSNSWLVSVLIAGGALLLMASLGYIFTTFAELFQMIKFLVVFGFGGIVIAVIVWIIIKSIDKSMQMGHKEKVAVKKASIQYKVTGFTTAFYLIISAISIAQTILFPANVDLMVWFITIPTIIVAIYFLTIIF